MPDGYRQLTIVEATKGVLSCDIFDFDHLVDDFFNTNEELADEDGDLGLDDATPAQRRELENLLADTLSGWLSETKLGRVWAFADIRQQQTVVLKETS